MRGSLWPDTQTKGAFVTLILIVSSSQIPPVIRSERFPPSVTAQEQTEPGLFSTAEKLSTSGRQEAVDHSF